MIEASALFTLPVLGALFAGVLAGLIGGALPGINGITTLTLLLPFVLTLDPAVALTLLLASHSVVYTGGAITAITFAIPGTPPNAAALEDGHRLAKLGLAARAIAIAATASGIGGVLGFFVLLAAIPLALPILQTVGAPEIFVAALVGLICVARIAATSFEKGLIPAALGIFLGSVGYQDASGVPRLWFEQTPLLDGIGLIPLIVGLFAGPELVRLAKLRPGEAVMSHDRHFEQIGQGVRDVLARPALVLKSASVGSVVGLVPGIGGEVAAFLAHAWFGRPKRHRSEIDDRITGVVAAETSNNAKEGGALVPTLTLGIPGSAGMAIMIGALVLLGFQPGPALMAEQTGLVILLAFVLAISNIVGSVLVLAFA
ncbi:MAG: tripartite tricarboxylate transporter permease, partial [Xanthobacteraceae bacterium]